MQSASESAISSCVAARIATLRPRAMFAPGSSISVMPGVLRRISAVPSVEPPSTMTISSGTRVWNATDARNSSMYEAASLTVETSVIFSTRPRLSDRPRAFPSRSPPRSSVRPARAPLRELLRERVVGDEVRERLRDLTHRFRIDGERGSPATSGSEEVLEHTSVCPRTMASKTGRPNPSYTEG